MLRRNLLIALTLVLGTVAAVAAEEPNVKLTGFVIDNMCADANESSVAEKAKAHPTACATMPNCSKSGYSVIVDGKRYKLDEEGNKKMIGVFKGSKTKKGLSVSVEGTVEGDLIHVKKIAVAESATN